VSDLLAFTVVGIVTGAIYAVAASGLVVTYTTSGVFNIAHGAMGMLMAFLYWQVRYDWGWPAPISLVFVTLIVAPLLGVLIERTLARDLGKASLVSSLVVTIGLLLLLMGLAINIWPPEGRRVDGFFGPGGIDVGPIILTWHDLTTLGVAAGVALGLRLLMFRTRAGITMRAVVDHRGLATLVGAHPARSTMLSWALGSSLAAMAGILLAPVLQLNVQALTLLVVNAYAAAMVGRLRSVPLTFVGALVLGLAESYAVGYLPSTGLFANVRLAIPTLMLFVVLLLLPEVRLSGGTTIAARMPRVPGLTRSLVAGAGLIAGAAALAAVLDEDTLSKVAPGLALGLIALSLVPLTGWAGQVSLCQMTFAGFGAFAMTKVAADGAPIGLLAAVALAVPLGALVALPAVRLRGLYLALATLAFATLADNVIFIRSDVFGDLGSVRVDRLEVAGVSFASERAYFVLLAAVFAVIAVGLLALRRGTFGRRLSALRDSQVACATMGLNTTITKVQVFALSAAIAALGGVLYAGLDESAGAADFTMFSSLPLVLLAVLGGITAVSGALVGGLVLAGFPVLAEEVSWLESLAILGPGLIGVTLARRPDGIVLLLGDLAADRGRATSLPDEHGLPERVEELGLTVPFEPEHVASLDHALAIDGA
jgi:branched-chain amino acid transport system permease protein